MNKNEALREVKAKLAIEFEIERSKHRSTPEVTRQLGDALTAIEIEVQKTINTLIDLPDANI